MKTIKEQLKLYHEEIVVEDIAIKFAEWMLKKKPKEVTKNGKMLCNKDLFEQFKKETGL